MTYQWIFFDADDTLFDFKRSARFALIQTLSHFQIKTSQVYFELYESINLEVWMAFERKEITAVELRQIRFEKFLDAIGEFRDPLEMNGFYLSELAKTDFLIDGARQVIDVLLEKNYRLCLITNGLKEVQRPRIHRANLAHYFESIVVSDEIGVAKPHAGFFEKAFSEIGFPDKKEVLVVGDSLSSDIQGGNNYGLDTCWYNPTGAANLTKHKPTYQIEHLNEVKNIIAL